MAILRFLLLEFEATLLVMARFATVRAKLCSGSVSVISTILRRTILALKLFVTNLTTILTFSFKLTTE
jgi:hypothetical protein